MWIKGNYRRNLLDMHIDDWNEEFLSKIDPEEYVNALADAGVQAAMVKAMPHTGLCYYPTKYGRMHKGLKGRDYLGEMIRLCHERDIAVIAYYSQVFDNYAYDNHPEWRTVSADGKCHKEFRWQDCFRNGRYGIVCPNNEEYREYVKAHLTELNENYDFEGMFLDMTFWPDVCYCAKCRERYFKETGKELPKTIDWQDEEFRSYQLVREKWMAEFAAFTTKCIKDINPDCTIEHQMSMVASPWIHACSESISDEVDYTGGDYYGGFLQQTFINKYYRNISPNLPFVYHTSRCDPQLSFHTTTKSYEELLLHVMTALVHNGAFLLVDAINPDGSIVPEVYHGLMKSIYQVSSSYEKYVGGELISDVGIWFATHSKFDPNETKIPMTDKSFGSAFYMDAPVKMASILRENNIPFDVIGSKNLKDYKGKVLALCHVSQILDEEMDQIEKYVRAGGHLYVSGPIGHKRLAELLGVEFDGVCCGEQTAENFTYMEPTEEGCELFEGFSSLAPLSVPMRQYRIRFANETANTKVLATLTLPYTVPDTPKFSAIHSNPPGIHTGLPAMIEVSVGKGSILYTAAPIEMSRPYMSRQLVKRIMEMMVGEKSFESTAPKFVETLMWHKDDKVYAALLNEQEESPFVTIHDIEVSVPKRCKKAVLLETGEELSIKWDEQGDGRVTLPPLHVFHMIEFSA